MEHCILYIVRHGETMSNKAKMVVGQGDAPLTDEGIMQVSATAEELREVHFDAVFTSDLPRAMRTGEILLLDRKLAINTKKALRERNFGKFEGRPSAEFEEAKLLKEKEGLSREAWWHYSFGDGFESDEELSTRFIVQLREIAVAFPSKTVLIVSHGGCIRTFLIKIGWAEHLVPGSFRNGGYMKASCDGVNFEVEKVAGIRE